MRLQYLLPIVCAFVIGGALLLTYERDGDRVTSTADHTGTSDQRAEETFHSTTEPVVPISARQQPFGPKDATSAYALPGEPATEIVPPEVARIDEVWVLQLKNYGVDPSLLTRALADPSKSEMAREVTRDFIDEYVKLLKIQSWEQQEAGNRYIASVGAAGMVVVKDQAHYHELARQMAVPHAMVTNENRYMFDLGVVGDNEYLDIRHKTLLDQEHRKKLYIAFMSDL